MFTLTILSRHWIQLFYPENTISNFESKTTFGDIYRMQTKSPYSNIFEAASRGASEAVELAAGLAANLNAFISLVAFTNAVLSSVLGIH